MFAWLSFDFANSPFTTIIITFIYSTFFVEVIVGETIYGTQVWSWIISGSAIFIAIMAPIMGRRIDAKQSQLKWLITNTLLCSFTCMALFLFSDGDYIWAGFFVFFSNIFFELSLVVYNALIGQSPDKDKIGRVSAYGWAAGYASGLLALIIALLFFVLPDAPVFNLDKSSNEHILALTLLVGIWYIIFTVPTVIHFKSNLNYQVSSSSFREALPLKKLISDYPDLWRFFLARLFYNDALITIFAFGGIYAMGTFDFSFTQVLYFGIYLNVFALIGSLTLSRLDDAIGSKKSIIITIVGLSFALVIAMLAQSQLTLWVAGAIIGFFAGPNQCMSRAYVVKLADKNMINEVFGWFAFIGKSTSFVGPFLIGWVTALFSSQRIGLISVLILFLIGFYLMTTVKERT